DSERMIFRRFTRDDFSGFPLPWPHYPLQGSKFPVVFDHQRTDASPIITADADTHAPSGPGEITMTMFTSIDQDHSMPGTSGQREDLPCLTAPALLFQARWTNLGRLPAHEAARHELLTQRFQLDLAQARLWAAKVVHRDGPRSEIVSASLLQRVSPLY